MKKAIILLLFFVFLICQTVTSQNIIYITTDVTSGNTDNQYASEAIIATNTIESGAFAEYKAGQRVELPVGFHAQSGSYFHAAIQSVPKALPQTNTSTNTSKTITTDDIESLDNSDLIVYPNPFNGIVNVVFDYRDGEKYQIAIYNNRGQFIKVENIDATHTVIDLYNLQAGVYFLKIYHNDVVIATTKIIRE